jgi:surface protein
MPTPTIVATNQNIHLLIEKEMQRQGNDADLNHIDVSNVTNMDHLFEKDTRFNGKIDAWDVSNVKSMASMFKDSCFNGDISLWNVQHVENMSNMFEGSQFNGALCQWNVGGVKTMEAMFKDSAFNQNISTWNVSNVATMYRMFENTMFNHPLNDWNVSNVECMSSMFEYARYNHALNQWNTLKLEHANAMFAENKHFNHSLDNWDLSSIRDAANMFLNTKMHSKVPRHLPPKATVTYFLAGVGYADVFPLSALDSIEDYKRYISELYGLTEHTTPTKYLAKTLRAQSCLSSHHGVLALLYPECKIQSIHPQMSEDHRNTLRSLFSVTNSVHLSVHVWMTDHVLNQAPPLPIQYVFEA